MDSHSGAFGFDELCALRVRGSTRLVVPCLSLASVSWGVVSCVIGEGVPGDPECDRTVGDPLGWGKFGAFV